MLGKHELHRLPALPPDQFALPVRRAPVAGTAPADRVRPARHPPGDRQQRLPRPAGQGQRRARFGEPLENINLNLDRPDDDRAEISQAVQAFTARRIQQRLEQTIEIPPLPRAAQKIIKLRVDPNASVDDITGLVETDPALAARWSVGRPRPTPRRADPLGGRRDRPRPRFRPGDQPGPRPRPGQSLSLQETSL